MVLTPRAFPVSFAAYERSARPNRAVEIRVIPGGLLREEPHPAHAKASLLDGMHGIGFDLIGKERAVAATFGILFALAALAATIYS